VVRRQRQRAHRGAPRIKLICTAAFWIDPLVAPRSFFVCARKLAQKHTSIPGGAGQRCDPCRSMAAARWVVRVSAAVGREQPRLRQAVRLRCAPPRLPGARVPPPSPPTAPPPWVLPAGAPRSRRTGPALTHSLASGGGTRWLPGM
jgi:hypothetical protein